MIRWTIIIGLVFFLCYGVVSAMWDLAGLLERLADWWHDRGEVIGDDVGDDNPDDATEALELAPERTWEELTSRQYPLGPLPQDHPAAASAWMLDETERIEPDPMGWQISDTGTLWPPVALEGRPELVDAFPALGREWRG